MFLFRTCVCCSFHYSLIFYASFSSSPRFCVGTFSCCFFIRLLFCYHQAAPPTAGAAVVVVYVCVSAVSVCLGLCPVMCTTGIFCCCVVLHVVARARLYFLLPFFLVCCPSASPSFCLFVRTFFFSYFRRAPGWGQRR